MSLPRKRTITLIVFLAMLAVTLTGGLVSYLCDCSGASLLTQEEHCHGDHGEKGSAHEAPPGHRHHEADADHEDDHDDDSHEVPADSGDHHHHELVKLTPTDALPPAMVAAPPLCLQPVLWFEISDVTMIAAEEIPVEVPPPPDEGIIRPLTHLVVRSVIFQV